MASKEIAEQRYDLNAKRTAVKVKGVALALLSFQALGNSLKLHPHRSLTPCRHYLLGHWDIPLICPEWDLALWTARTQQGRCHRRCQRNHLVSDSLAVTQIRR